jgi:hypothetical protein
MRLVRENITGIAEFDWNRAVQQEHRFTAEQIAILEQRRIVHTELKGGTDYYLIEEEPKKSGGGSKKHGSGDYGQRIAALEEQMARIEMKLIALIEAKSEEEEITK